MINDCHSTMSALHYGWIKEFTMKRVYITIMLTLVTIALFARFDLPKPDLNPFSSGSMNDLLNPNRLKMTHSMGFQAGTSSHGGGYYLSRYTNHIKYEFNPRLTLDLNLNFINYGTASTRNSVQFNDDNKSRILPEFSLSYKPTDSLSFQIRFQQYHDRYHPQNHSSSPW